MNESWINLEEVDLSENPELGNLGALQLSFNMAWIKLKQITLTNCNVGTLGIKLLKRNKIMRTIFAENPTGREKEDMLWIIQDQLRRDENKPKLLSQRHCSHLLPSFEKCLQGGMPQSTTQFTAYSKLLAKLEHYKEKIMNDKALEDEFCLYIEPRARIDNGPDEEKKTIDYDTFELAFDIRKHFLNHDIVDKSKILLLTGQAGIGKSFFCKYFQREMLADWINHESHSFEEEWWLPVYIDLTTLNELPSEIFVDTLERELSLTTEEVRALQELKPNNTQSLPRLLFIFDGCESIIQAALTFLTQNNYDDKTCAKLNLPNIIGAAQWKNAKIIVTCREEDLRDVRKRDLLFAPLIDDTSTCYLRSVPDSFLQRKIESFSNEQISCYLKKCCFFGPKELAGGIENLTLIPLQKSISSHVSSWSLVERFEKYIIDDHNSREIARIPFMLKVMVNLFLPDFASEEENQKISRLPKAISRRFLIEQLIENLLRPNTMEEKQTIPHIQDINEENNTHNALRGKCCIEPITQEAQRLALELTGYSRTLAIIDIVAQDNDPISLLKSISLVKFEQGRTIIKFCHPLMIEFFIAKKLEEEIIQINNAAWIAEGEILINQRLLTSGALAYQIIQFLCEALIDGRISVDQLLKLIKRSQESQIFTLAAANAITILNASGYDFSGLDFSGVSVAGANLRCGIFEGTNFTKANLQDVNFTGARIKDAKFNQAKMDGVRFGVIPAITLEKKAYCMAFFPSGNSLIFGTQGEVIMFQKSVNQKLLFDESKRLKGHIGEIKTCSFSIDNKYIITGGEDRTVCIWNLESCECVLVLRGHKSSVIGCNFCQNGDRIISAGEDNTIIIWDKSRENDWSLSLQISSEDVANCNFVPYCKDLMFIGKNTNGFTLLNSITGKFFRKYRSTCQSSQSNVSLSSDGTQAVVGHINGDIQIADFIRSHSIKLLKNNSVGLRYSNRITQTCTSFPSSRTQIVSSSSINLQNRDAADGRYLQKVRNIPENHYVATLMVQPIVFLVTALLKENPRDPIIKGVNQKRIDLTGVDIGDSYGLSEENILIFFQKGDYRAFTTEEIKALILRDRIQDINKITVIELRKRVLNSQSARVIARTTKWTSLKRLDIAENSISDEDTAEIACNTSWTNLEELILSSNQIADTAVTKIANNPCWKNLRKLHLSSNRIGDVGATSLGLNTTWLSLEELDLSQNEIGEHGASNIASNGSWKQLRLLNVSENKIGDTGAERIATNESWKCLEELRLAYNNIGDKGAAAIGSNTLWFNLKLLSLETNDITDDGVSVIADNQVWTELEELYLFDNKLSQSCTTNITKNNAWKKMKTLICNLESSQLQTIMREKSAIKNLSLADEKLILSDVIVIGLNINWINLEELNLSKNQIGDQGAAVIGSNSTWIRLRQLVLNDNKIGDKGAVAIGSNTIWIELEDLSLFNNQIGVEGARAIGKNITWRKLKNLLLYNNKIGDEGAIAIGSNMIWTSLEFLRLSENQIGDKGAVGLGKNSSWTKLQRLWIDTNLIGDEGAIALGSNCSWFNLKGFDLLLNRIGDTGAIALGRNCTWTSLQALNLGFNAIGYSGAAELGRNTSWTNLKILYLYYNPIGDLGVAELSKNTSWAKLQTLTLQNTSIGDFGVAELSRNIGWTNLRELDLINNSIGDLGAIELSKNATWTNIQALHLQENKIGSLGAGELSKNATWAHLQTLNLENNPIHNSEATD